MTNTPAQGASVSRPRVAIVDKSPIVRQALKDFIGRDGRFDVVGAVASGQEFLKLVAEQSIDIGVDSGWGRTSPCIECGEATGKN